MKTDTDVLEILKKRRLNRPDHQRTYEEETLNFQIALSIREAREATGLTQTELANKIDTKQSVISRLEDADYEGHSLSMYQKIAHALGRRVLIDMIPIKKARQREVSQSPLKKASKQKRLK